MRLSIFLKGMRMRLQTLRATIARRLPEARARHEGTKALERLLRDLTIKELRKLVAKKGKANV